VLHQPRAQEWTECVRPQLARRLIGGRSAEIDMPISGIKPMAMHAFWRIGVTAAVVTGRVRDRLGM